MTILDRTPLAGPGSGPDQHEDRPLTARGEIVRAPGSASDSLQVVLPVLGRKFGVEVPPQNWEPMGVALPAAGATCLVVFDSRGDAWVPIWHGSPVAAAGVTSFDGRTGPVTLVKADVTATGLGAADVAALPATDDLSAIAGANPTAGNVSMNGHKLTALADGSAATDAVTVEQMAVAAGLLLVGTGAPGSGTGADGQFYLDLSTLRLYGPKASGAWSSAIGRLMPTGPLTWSQIENG